MEPKQKTADIIQLMGKENKKQTRKTHQAVITAFEKKKKPNRRNGQG